MNASPARVRWPVVLFVALCGLLFWGGCVGFGGRRRTDRSSSVVTFLYPNQANPLPPTGIPVLRLPLRVGIAFVPSGGTNPHHYQSPSDMSEMAKNALLQRVAAEFKGRDYIESIEVVPTTYLRPSGSFDNLEQVRRMLNFDVIALVAYDQVQFTNENFLSLAYWTIVGAYVVHGNKNDTQTLMEAAVYDISSRHLLFRAPGGSHVTAGSTIVGVDARLREDSGKGFALATDDLIKNLKVQLEDFRTRAKQAPDTLAKFEHKPGYKGGGAMGGGFAGLLALLVLARIAVARRR
jgi:rhombotail lipoprotein